MNTQTISVAAVDTIQVEEVSGNLQLQGWEKPELEARGDVVQIGRRSGAIIISCSGDLVLSIPRGNRLVVNTIAGDARIKDVTGPLELTVVAGNAILQDLTGSVVLNGTIGGETRLENVANVSMNTTKDLGGFDMAERIRRNIERAARHAETKVRRAEHKAFMHAEMRIHQSDPGRWKYNDAQASAPAAESVEPVSDEERLTILRMLQDKKITSEQAAKLLGALEGGD